MKDSDSKDIIVLQDPATGKAVDLDGNRVNAAGYLIDEHGNIITKKSKVAFYFWEILFQEPPKIFKFTEFSLQWIRGRMDRDVTKNPKHDDEFDLDGRKINSLGYLIDQVGNIVDQTGKEVFKREILTQAYGQDAQIPYIFRSGELTQPQDWDDVDDPAWQTQYEPSKPKQQSVYDNTGVKTDD